MEELDWGGNDKPVLFLLGLGNSAHVFVDFAPKFTDSFHVYAITRRGFGASEKTASGYGIDTLAKNILAVKDALHIDRVILIGNSVAGDEMSKFTSSYPKKVGTICSSYLTFRNAVPCLPQYLRRRAPSASTYFIHQN